MKKYFSHLVLGACLSIMPLSASHLPDKDDAALISRVGKLQDGNEAQKHIRFHVRGRAERISDLFRRADHLKQARVQVFLASALCAFECAHDAKKNFTEIPNAEDLESVFCADQNAKYLERIIRNLVIDGQWPEVGKQVRSIYLKAAQDEGLYARLAWELSSADPQKPMAWTAENLRPHLEHPDCFAELEYWYGRCLLNCSFPGTSLYREGLACVYRSGAQHLLSPVERAADSLISDQHLLSTPLTPVTYFNAFSLTKSQLRKLKQRVKTLKLSVDAGVDTEKVEFILHHDKAPLLVILTEYTKRLSDGTYPTNCRYTAFSEDGSGLVEVCMRIMKHYASPSSLKAFFERLKIDA
ncbi:MAG: hypothetical protein ACK5O7_06880 [Holosporales bacterium]